MPSCCATPSTAAAWARWGSSRPSPAPPAPRPPPAAGAPGASSTRRASGPRPLAPRISPSKTLEGLIGGIVASILGAEAAGLYQDWFSGVDALLLGAAVGVAAPLGDLFESYLKRDRGVKDAGRLFGAHGGALARLDAVLFTAVTGYYVWLALM